MTFSSSSLTSDTKKEPVITETTVVEKHLTYEAQFTEEELTIISDHLRDRTLEQCLVILRDALVYHRNDPSLNLHYYRSLGELTAGRSYDETDEEWEHRVKFEAFMIHDWSIYPQVRSVTSPYEEPDDGPCETIRVYIISVVLSCAGSALATFFEPRFPSVSISGVALQILIAWWGKIFTFIPNFSFPVGFGRRVSLGGKNWTYKEQMLATCGMGVGDQSAYAQDTVIAMANKYFYNSKDARGNFGFAIMLTLSSNLMGFGLAGIFRVFLVYPVRYIWWGLLPTLRLSRTLVKPEAKETVNGWSISGYWIFWIAAISNFCWYWITNYVFPFLSYFDWMCWINPNDNNLISITEVSQGMGITPWGSLDPNFTGVDSMIVPFYATFMNWLGMFITGLVVIGMCYMNVSYTGYIAVNDPSLHDRFGDTYNVSMVLDENNQLEKSKYLEYGLPFWSAGNLVSYGSFFAFYPAIIVYAGLEYGGLMLDGCKMFAKIVMKHGKPLEMLNDRFSRAQRKYREVPEWWYMICLFGCLGMGIATVEHYKFTQTPVWTIFFGIGLSAIFMVPCGALAAVTNTSIEINVLYELVIGLAIPGNGNALMIAKTYATNFMSSTDTFVDNLKTGHYCNIPPRAMFRVQMINMITNSFVQAGLTTWQVEPNSIPDMCDIENRYTNKFICQSTRVYFNAAVQWGTIGPKRILRDLYPGMRYTFLFGALYPLPCWFLRHFVLSYARRHQWGEIKQGAGRVRNLKIIRDIISMEWATSVNEMVFLVGGLGWGSSSLGYYTTAVYLGWLFAVYIPRHYPKWWTRYTYLMYAGVSVGISIASIVVFFALQYHNVPNFDWWGNDASINLQPLPRLNVSLLPNGFGPKTWKW